MPVPISPVEDAHPPIIEGKVDILINDFINVFLDTLQNQQQQRPKVVPRAVYVTSTCLHAGNDSKPDPQRPLVSIPKLLVKGSPARRSGLVTQNTLAFGHSPRQQVHAWKSHIDKIINKQRVLRDDNESVFGWLTNQHAAAIMPCPWDLAHKSCEVNHIVGTA